MKTDGSSNRKIKEGEIQHKSFTCDISKSINEDTRTIDFIISNETLDRHGDIIKLKGWKTAEFMKNPVMLFAHQRSVPPIGKALKVWKSQGSLNAKAQFMSEEMSPFADSVFQMFKEGFLKAVSVGFMPIKSEFIRDPENEFITGVKFLEQELLEFSAVPVPSNPDALIKARTKGINVAPFGQWAEEVLDDWANSGEMIRNIYGYGKKHIELIQRKATGDSMTYQVPEKEQKELLEKNLKSIEEQKKKAKAAFEVNRSAIAYANSLIDKGAVDHTKTIDLPEPSEEEKEYLAKLKDDCEHQIIDDGTLFRKELITAKRSSALDDNINVFNAASRLLKNIDGDVTFEKNENEKWNDSITIKEFKLEDFEQLDVIQHTADDVKSIFYNNSPSDLVINSDLFKSSGGAIHFTGADDNLSIVLAGSNTDLVYYPYAMDNETGDFICKLDTGMDSNVLPISVSIKMVNIEDDNKEVIQDEVGKEVIQDIVGNKPFTPVDAATGVQTIILESATGMKTDIDPSQVSGGVNIPFMQVLDDKDDVDTDDVDTVTPNVLIDALDKILMDLEETLEANPDLLTSKGDKRFKRKVKFVAQYMRDIANAILPIAAKDVITDDTTAKSGNDNDSLTNKDVDNYLEEKLIPKLDEVIQRHVNKAKGRLPD